MHKKRTDSKTGTAAISEQLADAVSRVATEGERVILERRGKDVAALVSLDDLALLERLEDEQDLAAARKARREKKTVSLQAVKERLRLK